MTLWGGLTDLEAAKVLGIDRWPLLLPEEAAARLNMPARNLLEMARHQEVHHYRVSPRVIRFDPIAVELLRDPHALKKAIRSKRRKDERARLKSATTIVYVVQMEKSLLVKVGVARDVKSRLKSLQSGNPERLHVLLTVRGDYSDERVLHNVLCESKLHGEWFEWDDHVRRVVDLLKAGKSSSEIAERLRKADQ